MVGILLWVGVPLVVFMPSVSVLPALRQLQVVQQQQLVVVALSMTHPSNNPSTPSAALSPIASSTRWTTLGRHATPSLCWLHALLGASQSPWRTS